MHRFLVLGTLCLLLAGCGEPPTQSEPPAERRAEADLVPPLDEQRAAKLVGEAVECSARVMNEAVRLGSKLLLDDILESEVLNPTLVAYRLGFERRLDEEDFRVTAIGNQALARAMNPRHDEPDRKTPKHLTWSIAHPEHVVKTTVETEGRQARGVVHVRAEGAFEGEVHFEAAVRDGAWRVVAVTFPRSDVRLTRERYRWTLHPTERVATPNELRGVLLDLPTISEVGAEPTTDRIVITVMRDATFTIQGYRGAPLPLIRLRDALRMLTADPSMREADGSSKMRVILDVDETVPFLACTWVLQLLADQHVRIYRVYLGARAASGEAGALTLFLPKDEGVPATLQGVDYGRGRLDVAASTGETTSPRALLARLRTVSASEWDVIPLELAMGDDAAAVPYGAVLQILDAARHAGVRLVLLVQPDPPAEGLAKDPGALAEHLRKLRDRKLVPTLSLGGTPIGEAPPDASELPSGERVNEVLGFGGS